MRPGKPTVRRAAPVLAMAFVLGPAFLPGCSRPTLFPNPDPSLRKTSDEWRADAARRAYRDNVPAVRETHIRAQVAHMVNRIEVVNFTGRDLSNVEVWVNGEYVCHVPKMEDRKLKEIHFAMLYNAQGRNFPIDDAQVRKVELYCDGIRHELVFHNSDY